MKPQYVLIHCQPTLLDFIIENNMKWTYSPHHGRNEIDVVVDDIPYEIVLSAADYNVGERGKWLIGRGDSFSNALKELLILV